MTVDKNEPEPRRQAALETPSGSRPSAVTGFATKAKDLEALRSAVVDAAGVGASLWFSYLFVLFYLLIAVFSVTHRDLLYESPIKLPFLNVDLPLIGFFALVPLLFLIVHAYVLLHLVLLASKVDAFHTELEAQIADDDTRAQLRRQLPSNVFVQFLAGPQEVRNGVIGAMLRLIAQISLVAGPLALLLSFQLQFLPYHHNWVTWWHRLAIVADLALLWMLWPSVAHGKTTWIARHDLRTRRVAVAALASLFTLLFAFTIATFPYEWLDERLPSVRFIPTKWPSASSNQERKELPPVGFMQSMGWTSLHEILIGGDIDFVARKPSSLWSNRLVLLNIDVVDHAKLDTEEKIKAASETLSLRGRRLEGAVLLGARLRKVNLTGAQLQNASLDFADLREANLACASGGEYGIRDVDPDTCTHLQGATLQGARLQGANLQAVQLQGAELYGAWLQGADLSGANLQDANLSQSYLQGATLQNARMQGADLAGAGMQGADFAGAQLQGADFGGRITGGSNWGLQGANLQGANLQGANLEEAPLQGADLRRAELRGANLRRAELQGADLRGAELQGASLEQVFVWRADPRKMRAQSARIVEPRKDRPPSANWFADLKRLIEELVPDEKRRNEALKRIAILDEANPDQKADTEILDEWDRLATHAISVDEYETALADALLQASCADQRASSAIREAPVIFGRFSPGSPQPARIAGAFLDETKCPGANGVSDEDKSYLRQIRDGVSKALPPRH
jgi:uncharacterized protein YjbI with pentapeptide repeats